MSERDVKEMLELLEQTRLEYEKDPKARIRFLIDAGIITKEGKATEPYQHLPICIPPDLL